MFTHMALKKVEKAKLATLSPKKQVEIKAASKSAYQEVVL